MSSSARAGAARPPIDSPLALARADILSLAPYEHASWEPTLERLHANELPWRPSADPTQAGLNRYPEPQPRALLERLARLYDVPACEVLVGRGSDEAIDLLTRAFCRAGTDAVIVCPPTFGMYSVAARIQGAEVRRVPLRRERGFALDVRAILEHCTGDVKLVYVCSPNNPTGNAPAADVLLDLAHALAGRAMLVVDEAYAEFSDTPSLAPHVSDNPYLAVIRTLSKAHGLAGARCGTLIASAEVVTLLRKIIPPYALTQATIETVLTLTEPAALAEARARVALIRTARAELAQALTGRAGIEYVYPSAANFLLVAFQDAAVALSRARAAGLLVRDVRSQPGLERHLRITVGTPEQNARLLAAFAALPG